MSTTEIDVLKQWFKQQLLELMNVQACFTTRHNSLVVTTWTGVIVNIYFLDTPVRIRAIKRLLQESGEVGMGTMFVLKAELLPEPDARFEPKEWLRALHALMNDRLYTYGIGSKGPRISQVHFEPVGATGDYRAHYGPDAAIERLRYVRRSVKSRLIKGDWIIADFGFKPFWHNPNRAYRPNYRRPENGSYRWSAWSQTSWDQARTSEIDPPQPAKDRLLICFDLLEIAPDSSREETKAAFRRLAISCHPDTSDLPKTEAENRFHQLTQAYEYIRKVKNWS